MSRHTLETIYRPLEALIRTSDLQGVLVRWQFGRHLLEERGAAKRLPNKRLEQLCRALHNSRRELAYRMQFAERYPSEAAARAAFSEHGSWSAICESLARKSRSFDSQYTEVETRIEKCFALVEHQLWSLLPRFGRREAAAMLAFFHGLRRRVDEIITKLEQHIRDETWEVEQARVATVLKEIGVEDFAPTS